MDTQTGRIYNPDEIRDLKRRAKTLGDLQAKTVLANLKPMSIAPTNKQMNRKRRRILMNEPCGCGSGRKFKNCCFNGRT